MTQSRNFSLKQSTNRDLAHNSLIRSLFRSRSNFVSPLGTRPMPNVLHPHGSSSRLLLGPRPTIHVLHHSPLRARSRSFAPSSTLQVSLRLSSSSSSKRWQARQSRDPLARSAKLLGLKSRAAFKLLELDAKYKLFRPGATVVDLGFAPGSWSQVRTTT